MKPYKASPFLKWAGGKTQLLSQLRDYYPKELREHSITRYIEPFLGSGAVFFDVVQKFPIAEVFLFDVNKELILTFSIVQKKPQILIEQLHGLKHTYLSCNKEQRKKYYYQLRDDYNAQGKRFNYAKFTDEWILRAARMIFLNKTCYNGLYRVNSKGEFNVPLGSYERPTIFEEKNIIAASKLLQKATLKVGEFKECASLVDDNSFIYFDPPYRPISNTSNFTAYTNKNFTEADQVELALFFGHLDGTSDARLMLSNSNPKNHDPQDNFFEDRYSRFKIQQVQATRMINSNAKGRGKISELLITNY